MEMLKYVCRLTEMIGERRDWGEYGCKVIAGVMFLRGRRKWWRDRECMWKTWSPIGPTTISKNRICKTVIILMVHTEDCLVFSSFTMQMYEPGKLMYSAHQN